MSDDTVILAVGADDAEMPDRVSGSASRRRTVRRVAVGAAVVLVAVAAGVGTLGLGGKSPAVDAREVASTATTVAVERRTLIQSVTIDGTVDYGAPSPLVLKATGTITWLPAVGTVVKRGEQLLRVDDRPVVLLYGALPQYRDLAAPQQPPTADTPSAPQTASGGGTGGGGPVATPPSGAATSPTAAIRKPAATPPVATPPAATRPVATRPVATRPVATPPVAIPTTPAKARKPPPFTGNDVLQFERNLRKLGYFADRPDQSYTDATARAVTQWQRTLDTAATGKVGIGDVVYAPGPVRIAKLSAKVGAAVAPDTVSVSGNTRVVTAAAPAAELEWAKKGKAVSVTLPDGKAVSGVVASIGRPGTGEDGGDAPTGGGGDTNTVPVAVTVTKQAELGRLGGGPVTVTYVSQKRDKVLCVPVAALVALVEGGYGLEHADGTLPAYTAVTTGLFADGFVEVTGAGLREGMTVRMPGDS